MTIDNLLPLLSALDGKVPSDMDKYTLLIDALLPFASSERQMLLEKVKTALQILHAMNRQDDRGDN